MTGKRVPGWGCFRDLKQSVLFFPGGSLGTEIIYCWSFGPLMVSGTEPVTGNRMI